MQTIEDYMKHLEHTVSPNDNQEAGHSMNRRRRMLIKNNFESAMPRVFYEEEPDDTGRFILDCLYECDRITWENPLVPDYSEICGTPERLQKQAENSHLPDAVIKMAKNACRRYASTLKQLGMAQQELLLAAFRNADEETLNIREKEETQD